MNSPTIAVAGATGDMGKRVVREIVAQGGAVRALVRPGSAGDKLRGLDVPGVTIVAVDLTRTEDVTRALEGTSCVVSTLQGLRDVIVDAQHSLLEAAARAGTSRLIPSDYSSDFTNLPAGENRNFDLRREFHRLLAQSTVAATSIYHGAFAEMLGFNIPFLDLRAKRVGYFGSPVHRVDFTTKDNVAAYTAAAALDPTTPAALRIASFQLNAQEMAAIASELTGTPFTVVRLASLDELAASNRRDRAANPQGEHETFPAWQRSQYMHSMFATAMPTLDNARYAQVKWTSAREFIGALVAGGPRAR